MAGREAAGVVGYARHRPEQTLLYQLVEEHYPAFAALSMLQITLIENSEDTTLRMSDSIIGYVNDKTHYDVKEGLLTLFAENLKPYVEGNR